MAIELETPRRDEAIGFQDRDRPAPRAPSRWPRRALGALASLKLTVVLLAMGIFIVLVGTLAQTDSNMWDVIDTYFASYVAWIELPVLFPRSFFPNLHGKIPPFVFFFPGGASIGLAMIVNLLAAHAIRFRVQARGGRLMAGLAVIAAGVAVTWAVIAMGHDREGIQDEPFFEWSQFWTAIRAALIGVWVVLFWPLFRLITRPGGSRYLGLAALGGTQCALAALLAWIFAFETDLSDSSLRILWQLVQGGAAGLVLLAGCSIVFRRRAGIVLIHGGILLLMFGQFVATVYNVEERMAIREGATVHYAEDIRTVELAIVDRSPSDRDEVTAIPRELLARSADTGEPIVDPDLPFEVRVTEYHRNADLQRVEPNATNRATAGLGLQYAVKELRGGSGADASGAVDLAAAYVTLSDPQSHNPIGTYLVSVLAALNGHSESVSAGGKTYEVALRFRRTYKPYAMTLLDVVRDDYSGTRKARNYASIVRIVDRDRNVDREVKIWMNNPLRYAGETFYQSKYEQGRDGVESTELQVVRNTGWMIPYVACMIVGVGMIAHFWGTLVRFLIQREKALFEAMAAATGDLPVAPVLHRAKGDRPSPRGARAAGDRGSFDRSGTPVGARSRWLERLFVPAVVAIGLVWLVAPAVTRDPPASRGMDLIGFSELPVEFEGRVKPLETVARNALRSLSNTESFKDRAKQRHPAIRWFLDVVSDAPAAYDHRVVRIENLDVLQVLGLQPRKGFRYAINEFKDKLDEFERQVELASNAEQAETGSLSVYQRKILELDRRLRAYLVIQSAFRTPSLPDGAPKAEDLKADSDQARAMAAAIREMIETAPARDAELERMNPPRAIPFADGTWKPLASAYTGAYIARLKSALAPGPTPASVNEGALAFRAMLTAYAKGNTVEFNRELDHYRAYLEEAAGDSIDADKVRFEAFYGRFAPFFHAQWTYFAAFVLAALAWLGWSRPLNRASFWLIAVTFLAHTFAIAARIHISGRPPVTTLYSSAVFIGWGAVAFGMAIEILFRMGVGNLVASVTAFATLIIASFLANSGDTMPVLEAVLDTQFWLSTHVVSITLGYCATFVAGGIGLIYLLDKATVRSFDAEASSAMIRMIYGTICFAILFSFLGTVLGGLWADDSWGRFWGWDPKENGALIIVLWNAVVLHARWGRMIGDRGLAILAVGGNMATSWSWFGVNELGVGLHSYGFTEGVLLALGLFVVSQLAVMCVGAFLPAKRFQSALAG